MIRGFFHAFDFFVEAQRDTAVAQVIAKRLNHFLVGKFEQARAFLDERDAHAERREHAGVLDANHAAANDDHGFGNFRHAEDLVAVYDGFVVERNERGDSGLGAGGEDDVVGLEFQLAARTGHLDAMGIEKARDSGDDVDPVA